MHIYINLSLSLSLSLSIYIYMALYIYGGGVALVAKLYLTPLMIPWTVAHQALLSWDFPGRILEWVAISFSRGFS